MKYLIETDGANYELSRTNETDDWSVLYTYKETTHEWRDKVKLEDFMYVVSSSNRTVLVKRGERC
jgi:hypothetical protein